MSKPDGHAVVQPDGAFVGIWRTQEAAAAIVNRSPAAKGETIRPMVFTDADPPAAAWRDVQAERARQVEKEGWTHEHDDRQDHPGFLGVAAACYALLAAADGDAGEPFAEMYQDDVERLWPWDKQYLKPKSPREDLVRAGALILAEIERLDRIEAAK